MEHKNGDAIAGVDHIGLAVSDLEATRDFFVGALGFEVVKEDPKYPSCFVKKGTTVLTLWGVEDPARATAFDRRANVGLHHLALRVSSINALHALAGQLAKRSGITIEFSPEPVRGGPVHHMMIRDPSGLRIEFICRP